MVLHHTKSVSKSNATHNQTLRPMKPSLALLRFLIASSLLVAANLAHAQHNWTGAGSDASWATTGNWSNGSSPNSNTASVTFYNSAARLTNFISANRSINSLSYNADADSDVLIQLSSTLNGTTGRNLTFGGTAPAINVDAGSSGNHIIGPTAAGSVILASNLTIAHNGTGTLTIGRQITESGARSLTKTGTGILLLSANALSTYTGGTNVNGGILVFQNTNARPTTGTVTVGASGTIGLGVGGTGFYSAANVDSIFDGTLTGFSLDTASGVAIDTSAGNFTQNTDLTSARKLTKLGANTLTMSGANTYNGGTDIRSGIMLFTTLTSMPASGAVTVFYGATLAVRAGGAGEFANGTSGNGTIGGLLSGLGGQSGSTVTYAASANVNLGIDTTNAGGSLTYSGNISDAVGTGTTLGITKLGTGTLVLDGTNTFTGNIRINNGTLQSTADNQFSSSAGIEILGNAAAGATLDLNGKQQTLNRLVFTAADAPGNLTITGGAGSKLTINATSNTEIGPGGEITSTSGRDVTADFSGLGEFAWNGSSNIFRVGARQGTTQGPGVNNPGTSTVTLAATNAITATRIAVGDLGASRGGGTSILRLGQSNALHADTINIGTGGRNDATLEFRSGLTDPSATIRGTLGGTERVNLWEVGKVATFSTADLQTWATTVDFSAGSLDARVNDLRIGMADAGTSTGRTGTVNASFTMTKGTLDVTTLNIGMLLGSQASGVGGTFAGNGTFTLDDATGKVTAENVYLGVINNSFTSGTPTTSGTFNLTAGTLEAKVIDRGAGGAQTGLGTATRALNFTSGTIRNYAGSNLAIANVPLNLTGSGTRNFEATAGQSITVASTAVISGSGLGFTKIGDGTLVLEATNTYTGATNVNQGTLLVNGSLAAGHAR